MRTKASATTKAERAQRAALDQLEKTLKAIIDDPEAAPTAKVNAIREWRQLADEREALDAAITNRRKRASFEEKPPLPVVSNPSAGVNPRSIDCDITRLDDVALSVALHFAKLICKLHFDAPKPEWELRREELESAAETRWGANWSEVFYRLYEFEGSRR